MNQICTGPLPAAGLSRRAFLNRFGLGMGGMALANMMSPANLLAAMNGGAENETDR